MKPLKLTIEGFKPFKTKQEINFSNLDFFVIRGSTGSGKSSILDAIVFALFGKLEELKREDLINKNSQRALVDFSFSVKGKEYRIVRYIPRSGTGEVRFYEEGKLKGWKTPKINKRIEEILGTNLKQFQQIFFLPQGRYDRFIKGTASERKKILETLLDLEIYNLLAEKLKEEFIKTETELQNLENRFENLSEATPTAVETIENKLKNLEKEKKQVEFQIKQLKEQVDKLKEKAKLFDEIKQLEEQLQGLTGVEYENLKKEIQELEKLEPAKDLITELSHIEDLLTETQNELSSLEEKLKEKQEKLKELEELTQKLEQNLKNYDKDKAKIEKLKETLAKLEIFSKIWNEYKESLNKKEQLERKLKEIKKAYSNIIKKLDLTLSEKEKIEVKLSQVNYNPEREKELITLLEKSKRKVKLLEAQSKIKKQLEIIEKEQKNIIEEFQTIKKALEETEKRFEDLDKRETLKKLLKDLKEGEPCPICGRPLEKKHLEKFSKLLNGEDERDISYNTLKEKLEKLRKTYFEKEKQKTSLDVKRENLLNRLKEIEEELKTLNEVPPIEKIKEELKTLQENAKLKEKLENQLKKIEQTLNSLREQSAKLKVRKENLEENLAEINRQITNKENTLKPLLKKLSSKISISAEQSNPFEKVKISLKERIKKFEEEYEQLQQKKIKLDNSLISLKKEIEVLQSQHNKLKEHYENLQRRKENLRKNLEKYIHLENQFEIKKLKEKIQKLKNLREQLHRREGEIIQVKERIRKLKKLLKEDKDFSLQKLEETEEKLKNLEEKLETIKHLEIEKTHLLNELKKLLEERQKLEKEIKEQRLRYNLIKTLKEDFRVDRLQRFVIAKTLNDIAEIAGYYSNKLSDGRYTFALQEEELLIYDSHEDAFRKVQTLSGGETFLASLSFALGFGQYLGSNASVESLFIDEGFGTLDSETLGRVEDIFEIIRSKVDKIIGVITHLDALAEIFDKRIEVIRTPEGSKIEVINAIETS